MKEQKVDIRNHKARNKFCVRQNKYFGCKEAHMCNISCPLWHWYEVVLQMDMKNLPLGEAFRLSYRKSISAEERREIFKDRIENKDKQYPPKSKN